MDDHSFCRASLRVIREMAKESNVKIPKGLSTYRTHSSGYFNDQFQISTAAKPDGVFISAHCAYEAKTKYISRLIERQEENAK